MRRAARFLVALALVLALAGWPKPQQLETAAGGGAAVQGDGHGHRGAPWLAGSAVGVAVAGKGRDFGPALTLARADGLESGPGLVVGPRGDALVVWFAPTRQEIVESGEGCCIAIQAALLSRSGRVTGPVTLASPVANGGLRLVFGAGSHGRFAIAWSLTDPEVRFARMASIRRGFGVLERVPGGGLNNSLTFDRGRVRVQSILEFADLQEVSRNEAGRWS